MQKNVASQKLIVFAFDSTTNLPKTGDAANITAYVSKDYGAVTVLGDTTATEMDSTNAKGYYLFDLTQAESNADTLLFSAKSSTANIVVVGAPATAFTTPPNFNLESIDANGRVDVIKIAGTAQTGRDIGASVLLAAGSLTEAVFNADAMDLFGIADLGTAQSATATTLVLRAAAAFADGELVGATIFIVSATTGAGQSRVITAYAGATDTATVDAWTTTPTGTIVYKIFASAAGSASSPIAANVVQLLGTAWLAPAVAGTPDVNAKQLGGTAQTGRDIGASVLLSAGAGAGQLDFTAGVVKSNPVQILGTALTETAGQIAAAFKQFFNVASPTGTMKAITNVVTVTNLTTNNDKTGYALTAAYDPAKTASQAGDAMTLTAAERNATADALLDRNMATGADTGGRTVRNALRFLRNKWTVIAGTLSVKKEDDATEAWNAAITTDVAAVPIVGNDPS